MLARLVRGVLALALTAVVFGLGAAWLVYAPASPLPDHLNPARPFKVSHPPSPLTSFKLRKVVSDEPLCRATLAEAGVKFTDMSPLDVDDENCGIAMRGKLSGIGQTYIDPLETSCETALRLALWHEHSVQPAARDLFGEEIVRLYQVGSYNCRKMRTSSGTSNRYSTHATAASIDITGVKLQSGRSFTLLKHWEDEDAGAYLRAINKGACDWFGLVLGPEYNRLHADHFHLQNRGWGGCR